MAKIRYLSDADLMVVGRRHGSDEVAREAGEAQARWRRDVAALAAYGFGQAALDAFSARIVEHAKLQAAQPDAVACKKLSVVNRDRQVSLGWAWVARVGAVLGTLARTERDLATALATATPVDDAGLESGVQALAFLLTGNQQRLPPDAQAARRLAEVDALSAGLLASAGTVHTQQLDLADGKLCVTIRDLSTAARAAIRNGDLRASLGEYTLHHLEHSGATAAPSAPVPSAGTVERPSQPHTN